MATLKRGKGIGTASIKAVIEYLEGQGSSQIFSRHLVDNAGATKLLEELGFHEDGDPYVDSDRLNWQIVSLKLK